MTRPVPFLSALLTAVLVIAAGGSAAAQDLRALQARNAAAQSVEDARRDMLSSQIETSNANERARTDLRLRSLDAQRTDPGTLAIPSARATDDANRRDAALIDSMDRMERLTQDALAQSNARMRAIQPASQPNKP